MQNVFLMIGESSTQYTISSNVMEYPTSTHKHHHALRGNKRCQDCTSACLHCEALMLSISVHGHVRSWNQSLEKNTRCILLQRYFLTNKQIVHMWLFFLVPERSLT